LDYDIREEKQDEYQSCSGIGHEVNKKTVVEEKDSAGASAQCHLLCNSVPAACLPG
jgi:hypothetical protein